MNGFQDSVMLPEVVCGAVGQAGFQRETDPNHADSYTDKNALVSGKERGSTKSSSQNNEPSEFC